MEENENPTTLSLLTPDMFKKQLKNYFILFAQQQTIAKQNKTKKVKSDEPQTYMLENSKLKQFKVSSITTVSGIIEFTHDSEKIALEFNIYNPNTKKKYKEILYLPIIINLNDILNEIRKLKEEIYLDFKFGISNVHQLSNDIDYIELISLENEILSIINEIKQDNIDNINNELETENELLIKHRMLYDNLQSYNISENMHEQNILDYNSTMSQYLMVNQSLNHVLDDNNNIIIYPGTRIIHNHRNGIIIKIDKIKNIYVIQYNDNNEHIEIPISKKITGEPEQLFILSSVRNSISESNRIIFNNCINLSDLLKKVKNLELLIDILSLLNINLSKPDINNRPRLEIYTNIVSKTPKKITIIDKINTFYTTIDLKDIFNSRNNIIIGKNIKHTPNNMDIKLDNWRQLLSLNNDSYPFIIDDFEFNSVKHYHFASQFYNREDLSYNIRMEYNNYFIKFTNNYTGSGSLSKIDTNLCSFLTDNTVFKKPVSWSANTINGDSLESIYLKKAYYNKFIQNKELKDALIKSYPCIIYEKIGKNKLFINYELMLVRYYLFNNITPYFSKFNYNSSIFKNYIQESSQTKDYEYNLLLNVFVKHNAYQNRENLFFNTDILYAEYSRLDISGKTSIEIFKKYCNQLLFSYNSIFIYELVENYILTDSNLNKSIEALIKKNDLTQDQSNWIFHFYYEYISINQKQKEQIVQDDLLFEKQLQDKYRALQTNLKANNYLIVESAFRLDENYLDSVIEYLNRNKFPPFDFSSNVYEYSKVTFFQNSMLNKKEFPIYDNAIEYLNLLMNNLYDLNNTSDVIYDDLSYYERFELLSVILSLDIQIISETNVRDIFLKDIKGQYPKLLDKIISYEEPRGRLVLGYIEDPDYFFSTKPYFASKDRENIKYLIAIDSKYVIEENISENGEIEHIVIGRWNPINMILNKKDNQPGDLLNGNIEIDDFMLYSLDSRIYYKDKELYF